MDDLTLEFLIVALIIVLSVVLIVLFKMRTKFEIFNDLIVINDFAYPANIPNYVIESITLIEKLPKVIMRTNGYGGIRTWKGIFRIEGSRRAVFFVEDHHKGPFIKIKTVRESIYINLKDREQTQQLFDEMTKTVKILSEPELVEGKIVTTKRSWQIVAVFIVVVMLVSMIPAFIS